MTGCPSNCNDNGVCNNGECVCNIFFSGEDCSTRWRSNDNWWIFWNVFVSVAILLHSICLITCLRFLYANSDKLKTRIQRWPISIHIMFLGAIASLMRVVILAVDPYCEREITPIPVFSVFFNVPIVIAECIVLMLFLYWFEVAQKKRLDFPNNVKKLRPILIGLCIFVAGVLLPIAVIANSLLNTLLISLSNILLAIVLLCIFVILFLAGLRLTNRLTALQVATELVSTKSPEQNSDQAGDIITAFIFRVRWYLAGIGLSMALEVILLVTYVVTNARYNQWTFVGFHFAFRVFEFTYIMPTLMLLVQRKRPTQNNASYANSTLSIKTIS